MKVLASATLVLSSLVISIPALAEIHDFSKTTAAKPDYHFADNEPVKVSFQRQSSSYHDFSKTVAANDQYDFSDNDASPFSGHQTLSSQHDFSKTEAARNAG